VNIEFFQRAGGAHDARCREATALARDEFFPRPRPPATGAEAVLNLPESWGSRPPFGRQVSVTSHDVQAPTATHASPPFGRQVSVTSHDVQAPTATHASPPFGRQVSVTSHDVQAPTATHASPPFGRQVTVFSGEVGVPFAWRSPPKGQEDHEHISLERAAAEFCPIVGCDVEWLVEEAARNGAT